MYQLHVPQDIQTLKFNYNVSSMNMLKFINSFNVGFIIFKQNSLLKVINVMFRIEAGCNNVACLITLFYFICWLISLYIFLRIYFPLNYKQNWYNEFQQPQV
jgi:hypothetical protein